MRPRKRQETGKQDLFGSRLDRIIDLTRTGEAFARDRLASPAREFRSELNCQM